jgi:hypothetical protein
MSLEMNGCDGLRDSVTSGVWALSYMHLLVPLEKPSYGVRDIPPLVH